MLHFKYGIGWKACYDDERNLYTAKTSWRGDFDLYEINEEIYNQLGNPDVSADELIHSGRHLYYSQDNPIGPPTDMVIDENYATLCPSDRQPIWSLTKTMPHFVLGPTFRKAGMSCLRN